MRKRIVIGLLILSVIGTAVFFVLQPKEGSVEWHKKEFTEAASRMKPGAWSQRLGRTYQNVTRRDAPWIHDWHEEKEKYLSSYAALVNTRYLERRRFALTKRHGKEIQRAVEKALGGKEKPFVWFLATRDAIVVMAPSTMMPRVEEIVRKADVP